MQDIRRLEERAATPETGTFDAGVAAIRKAFETFFDRRKGRNKLHHGGRSALGFRRLLHAVPVMVGPSESDGKSAGAE